MGTFLALSAVVGKTKDDVANSLKHYAESVGGGLQKRNDINSDIPNCCIIEEASGNTSVLYPCNYFEWDNSSEFISKELNAAVFSFHIHDGDLWMYILYHNGKTVDQFNPIPDCWDGNISDEEIAEWKGNAQTIAAYMPSIKISDIDKYLVRWDLETRMKAYPQDEFAQEDWQMVDFMDKLKLPYPLDEKGNHKGDTYKLWTRELKLV